MAVDETTSILRSIEQKLTLEGDSASLLISEVRNSIRSTGEPTLAKAIVDLNHDLQGKLTALQPH